ncbi:DUF6082 family protein [Streptomyces monticola]|uniref:DUF6082 family protein n=1 Tax=Streptomyces monticola TaxID=2666263 RepID=A0ABW2J9N8_9ACTN
MATQKYGTRRLGSAAFACATGALALLAARERRYTELRLRVEQLEHTDHCHRHADLTNQHRLQFDLLTTAMNDPDLAAVISTVEAEPTTRRQYLFANALYTNALHAFRIGIVSLEELYGHLRVICQNPVFREYWEATRHQRASLKEASDEAKVGRMVDGLIRDLDESDGDEWWVVGEPPAE